MMARNHMPFAMCCYWLGSILTGQPITGLSSLMAGLGGLLPDIDHPESTVGRRVKLLSLPLSAVFGHRGMTHSLLAVIIVGLTLAFVMQDGELQALQWVIAPLCIGYLSHILGDGLTPSGVPLLWPKKKTYSLNLFKTNSRQETLLIGALTLGLLTVGGVGEVVIGYEWHKIRRSVAAMTYDGQ
ncbi:MAG: metal-dependent hydrolase [Thermosynechococcaceae cyanobacterium]